MVKKIIFGTLLLFSVSSQAEFVVCNKYSCQPMSKYDPKEVIEVFAQTFSGGPKELSFCEANKENKTCSENPITFEGKTNFISVQFRIPFARILQIWPERENIRLLMDYQIQANQYYPVCSPASSSLTLSVTDQGDFLLNSPNFDCRMTELGQTKVTMDFTIDYLNLDTGVIGATYQSLVKGDVLGGGTGYVLMHVSNQRSIKMPRPVPTDFVSENGYYVGLDGNGQLGHRGSESGLVDWDWAGIKKKWNNFKTKFLKILYLEPL